MVFHLEPLELTDYSLQPALMSGAALLNRPRLQLCPKSGIPCTLALGHGHAGTSGKHKHEAAHAALPPPDDDAADAPDAWARIPKRKLCPKQSQPQEQSLISRTSSCLLAYLGGVVQTLLSLLGLVNGQE
jgi:hypothetical protein